MRQRLSSMSDDQVRSLWKVNTGYKGKDLRMMFKDHEMKPGDKLSVFQHAHPRVQRLQYTSAEITDHATMLNKEDPGAKIDTSHPDETVYLAPDGDVLAPITVTQNDSWFQPTPGLIRILSWTPKYSFKKEWFMRRKLAFHSCNLPENRRCEYTADKDKYNISDVILFRLRLLKNMKSLPRYRSPKQKWLVYESESPSYVWPYMTFPHLETTHMKKIFNISSTYSTDSNIPFRGLLRCSVNETKYQAVRDVNLAANKTKLVAWFVSNCKTPSRREDYVKELQKHIPVDIYGDCGPLKCGSQTLFKTNRNIDCYDTLLNNSYKFYLSFENSLCKNYVTEKLWNLYLRNVNVIPVVLGYDKYSDMVPKGTFIDVRDFQSPAKLAEYLMLLDKDETLFNKYLRRKAALKCTSPKIVPYKCKLCEYLHRNKHRRQVVEDIRRYWSEETKCKTPEMFYKNIANLTFDQDTPKNTLDLEIPQI